MRTATHRRTSRVLPLLLGAALVAAGLWATPAPAAAADSTVYVGLRTARLHVPAGVAPTAPLVVVLHGGTGSASQAQQDVGMDAVADTHGFMTAYPAGQAAAWNAGECCGTPRTLNTNDVKFLDDLVAKLRAQGTLAASAPVFATGISNGAMMAYRWACEGSTSIAGLGLVAGTRMVATCAAPRTRTIVHVHGTADVNIPEDGDPAKVDQSKKLSTAPTRSVNTSVLPFLAAGGCSTTETAGVPAYNQPAPSASVAFGPVVRGRWTPCSPGTLVEKFVLDGGGHSWPCGRVYSQAAGSIYDQPSELMDASRTMAKEFGIATGLGAAGEPVPCVR